MSHLIISFVLFFMASESFARCGDFTKAAELLTPDRFVQRSRESRALGVGELSVNLQDVNQAKSLAFKFPAFQQMGFGLPGREWQPYNSRMQRSAMFGRRVGWETRSADGGHARVRLDWDPQKGAHYNIEISKTVNGRSETHKLAVGFQCQNRPCSERDVVQMLERMDR